MINLLRLNPRTEGYFRTHRRSPLRPFERLYTRAVCWRRGHTRFSEHSWRPGYCSFCGHHTD